MAQTSPTCDEAFDLIVSALAEVRLGIVTDAGKRVYLAYLVARREMGAAGLDGRIAELREATGL